MDLRLRLLLKRFAANYSPEDAIAFAMGYLRSTDVLSDPINVWMVQWSDDPDGSDSVELFSDKQAAHAYVCQIIANALEEERTSHDVYDLPHPQYGWVPDFEMLVENQMFVSAANLYEEQWVNNHHWMATMPEITITEEPLRDHPIS